MRAAASAARKVRLTTSSWTPGIELARAELVRLVFDRGTLLLLDVVRGVDLSEMPGLLWDPRVRAFRAPAYRHREVTSGLASRGVRFSDEVVARAPPPATWSQLELRSYQRDACVAWDRAGRRGVIVLPTGSGKTRVALAIAAKLQMPALVLVPTRVLLDQWCREIAAVYLGRVGRYGDGAREVEAITVSTFESALRNMDAIGNRFGLLIVDEAHHFGAGVHDEALEMCTARARLGLTATPLTDPAARGRVDQLIGGVVYELGVGDLAGSFLAPLELITLRVDLTAEEGHRYGRLVGTYRSAYSTFRAGNPGASWKEFTVSAGRTAEGRAALRAWRDARRLVSACEAKRQVVTDLLIKHRGARTLVFVADNHAAYELATENLIMPLTCEIGRAERAAALQAFRMGELRALVSARVLNEGLDVPDAEVAIVVGSALGEREYVQRVGRLLRPKPEKRAIVYELVARATTDIRQLTERRRGLAPRRAADLSPAG